MLATLGPTMPPHVCGCRRPALPQHWNSAIQAQWRDRLPWHRSQVVSWEGPWRGPAHDPLGSGVLYTQGLGSPGRAPEGSGVA
jgi:hypothetical protein